MTTTPQPRHGPTMQVYVMVWIGLVCIVGAEVLLAYAHLRTGVLLACLLALALVEAGVGLLFFMHLKYERARLAWWLIPVLLFVFLLMDHLWPDAFRLAAMRGP
ncbi:MAG TPA: cytochrome C oxidase subunit IV family protein [Gemmatimonadales bacterium]|nr:cytochrome C oxidase subunit IV family protein [Gemmatimonadales bacterium]HSB56009.1 cytochrome C oxidase subunit IV family protein [Gemmatimonadales bacterium]